MVNVIVRPFEVVLFQAIVVVLPGFLYAAMVLAGRSLWPAVLIHWLTNAAVNIKILEHGNYQETFEMWTRFAIILIPLIAFSAYLLSKLPDAYTYEIEGTDYNPPVNGKPSKFLSPQLTVGIGILS